MRRFFARGEAGQAIVMISLMLLVLFMFAGLAVDAGQLYSARRTMQEAADSAAYAGAVIVYQKGTKSAAGPCGSTTTDTSSQTYLAAVADATRNGFTNGVAGNTVTINNPPLSGAYCGDNRYVEVTIQTNVQTALVPAESGLTAVGVRAVAGAEPLNNGYAVMAIDRASTPSAFYADNQADIHITGGGILVNSTSATAAVNQQTNGCRFTVGSPYGLDINGNTGSTFSGCASPPSSPPPVTTMAPQVPDPFAGYPKPSTSGLPVCSSLSSPGCQDLLGNQNPGVYTTSLKATGSATVTINPGIYILEVGINQGGTSNVVTKNPSDPVQCPVATACGVLIFNTKTNYPNSTGADSCGSISLAGNASSNLYASVDPNNQYAHLLIYQDPICSAPVQLSGSGSATFDGAGTIYAPSAQFRLDGQNVTLTGSQVIAKTVFINGGNLNIDFNAGNTAQPILPRLSE